MSMDTLPAFALTTERIDAAALSRAAHDPACGAFVAFEGWVRDHNDGKGVHALAYEAYTRMALKEGARIVEAVKADFGLRFAHCVHRTGELALGDCAVWVGVSAPHRGEAFAACRRIIDDIKKSVPIWKKEAYADGDSGWVNCEEPASPSAVDSSGLYARQMALPGVGPEGQARLSMARVLVVGAGGLGCGALPYLAAAGIGRLGIADGDAVELHNLHRQVLFTPKDIGQSKAHAAAERIGALNPKITARPIHGRVDHANAKAILDDYSIVLDCTDDIETKFLLNDTCVRMGKTLISASIHQYEGHLFVYRPEEGAACLRSLWEVMPMAGASCAEAGVLGAVPGVFGALQASEALKVLLDLPGQLRDELLLFDLLTLRTRRVRIPRATRPPITQELAERGSAEALEVDAAHAMGGSYRCIDMRLPANAAGHPLAGWEPVAIEAMALDALPFGPDDAVALLCEHGLRSRVLALGLRERGYARVVSVRGGTGGMGLTPIRRSRARAAGEASAR